MDIQEVLSRLLSLTEENNRILRELQDQGIAIQMPGVNSLELQDLEGTPIITKNIKPKISKDQKKVIEKDSGITAWIDEETGLMWEVKNDKNKNLIMSQKETLAYADNLNIIEYSGFTDWRVPTLKELKTLLSKTKKNFLFIKTPLSKNTNYGYWTSTKYDENFYMTVNFHNGKEIKSEKHNFDYVRCVRG